jgi:two-component system sensor histidine kinase DesK
VDRQGIAPGTMALLWRLMGLSLLSALWIARKSDETGLILVLVLAVLALARWRFTLPAWTTLLDQAACIVAALFWPDARFAFTLPVFDSFLAMHPEYSLPTLVALVVLRGWSIPAAAALGAAAAAGASIHLWARQLWRARGEADRERRQRYELESLKGELLSANVRVARLAEMSERARIARDLHDHAGHEITAALLALEAFRRVWQEGDPQAGELLEQAAGRVTEGMRLLRRTVHDMAPGAPVGLGSLEEICRRFTTCEVALCVHGDTVAVPTYAWGVLEPCLKEALTNAVRHAAAARIDVSLDVGPHIVRMCVHNPTRLGAGNGRAVGVAGGVAGGGGTASGPAVRSSSGVGLHSLSQRVKAVGGSLTTDSSEGFRLICVLPLDEGPP